MTDRPRVAASRLGPRSLTARLIAGVVALVVALVLAISAGTYFALRSFLTGRLDSQLQTTANGDLGQLFQGTTTRYPDLSRPQKVYAVAITSAGEKIFPHNSAAVRLNLTDEQLSMLAERRTHTPLTITLGNGDQMRVTVRAVTAYPPGDPNPADSVPATAVIGLDTDEEKKTLHQLVLLEFIIGGAAIVLAFLATSYGVRFSLRNLRRVTDTADEVAAELSPTGAGLERRVDVPDDGTEVGRLAESMNTLLATVEAQFAARLHSEDRLRQFLADASHELRTPLTSIRGYAELARMQRAAGGDAEDNLARIESEGTRMSRLVEDLLMLARGDQMSPTRNELVDVGELLAEAVDSARAAFPERPIDAQLTAGLHVVGDPDQLFRIVRNLVGNAEMHTAKGRPVLVRCLGQGPEVLIQVIDGGPGLPPDEAAHVFERFWRADKARSRAHGGTGLGMSIVAAIVAAHGGSVAFVSSVEQGSTVTVRLPAVDGSSDDVVDEAISQPAQS